MRSLVAKACWLLLALPLVAACSSLVHNQLAPDKPYLVGVYDWEVPHDATGFLVVRTPVDSAARDSLLTVDGYVVQCQVPNVGGPLVCGNFTFYPSRYGLTGNFESCNTTVFPQRRVHNQRTADFTVQYVQMAYHSCDTVRMGVWKRTGRVERE